MLQDDRVMSILTGLVIVIAMAVLAQKSDSLYDFFAREEVARIAPQNDETTVPAGQSQVIDVLANDENAAPDDGSNLRIVVSPSCGAAEATPTGVLYIANERCVGPQLFAYCVAKGDECPSASVTVNVTQGPIGGTLVGQDATPPKQDEQIARAPAVEAAPSSVTATSPTTSANVPAPANVTAAVPNVTDQTEAPTVADVQQPDVATAPAAAPTVVGGSGPVVAAINPLAPSYKSPTEPAPRIDAAPMIGADDGGDGGNVVAALPSATESSVLSDGQSDADRLGSGIDRSETATSNLDAAATGSTESPDVSNIEVEPTAPALPPTEVASLQPPVDRSTVDRVEDEQIAAVRRDAEPTVPQPRPRRATADGCGPVAIKSSGSSGGASLLRIESACRAGETYEVVHAGLRFGGRFDETGNAELTLPVMDIGGDMAVLLQDGTEIAEQMQFNRREVELTLRVAVAWTAPVDLDLHAFEYAAGFGADGHVWQESPRGFRLVRRGGGGYLNSYPALSADGQSIEVYTFWANSRARRGTARIAVDHASRGDVPDGAFCGDGELASPSYELVKSERGVLQVPTRGRFAPAQCGQQLNADSRYLSSALNDLRIE